MKCIYTLTKKLDRKTTSWEGRSRVKSGWVRMAALSLLRFGDYWLIGKTERWPSFLGGKRFSKSITPICFRRFLSWLRSFNFHPEFHLWPFSLYLCFRTLIAGFFNNINCSSFSHFLQVLGNDLPKSKHTIMQASSKPQAKLFLCLHGGAKIYQSTSRCFSHRYGEVVWEEKFSTLLLRMTFTKYGGQ